MNEKRFFFKLTKTIVLINCLGLLLFLMISCKGSEENELKIATAANMQFAMQELTSSFSKETGIACEIIVGSSGKLTAQIKMGAPFDIFVSADMKYPNELYRQGLTTGKPKIYAYGKLVIWTMNSQLEPIFESFFKNQVKHIAIANPKTAPYGVVALEVLKKRNIYHKIKDKLVFGESVSQTNQFITTYSAQLGITSKSSVLSPVIKEKGIWKEIDAALYNPIDQGIVILKNQNTHLNKAMKFNKFLFSTKATDILNKFGYSVNN